MRFPTLITDERARPIIPLILMSPAGERVLVDALVDTGADITLFSETVAEALSVDLTNVPESPIRTPLGHAGTYRAVELSLELRRRPDVLQWRGTVGFVSPRLTYGLLGTRGFFEFFAIHYDASQQFLEILPSGTASTTTSQPHIT